MSLDHLRWETGRSLEHLRWVTGRSLDHLRWVTGSSLDHLRWETGHSLDHLRWVTGRSLDHLRWVTGRSLDHLRWVTGRSVFGPSQVGHGPPFGPSQVGHGPLCLWTISGGKRAALWNISGGSRAALWTISGGSRAALWTISGGKRATLWTISGGSRAALWTISGGSRAALWTISGGSRAALWTISGGSRAALWTISGGSRAALSLDHPRWVTGRPLDHLRWVTGRSLDHLRWVTGRSVFGPSQVGHGPPFGPSQVGHGPLFGPSQVGHGPLFGPSQVGHGPLFGPSQVGHGPPFGPSQVGHGPPFGPSQVGHGQLYGPSQVGHGPPFGPSQVGHGQLYGPSQVGHGLPFGPSQVGHGPLFGPSQVGHGPLCLWTISGGKRAALWTISDDSDDAEAEPENEESDSGDEEHDDPVNGDDEDDDDDDDDDGDDGDEEEDAKPHDGGGVSAGFTGISSDEDSEKCPICLNTFSEQPVATPENCEHYFCFDCILEWTKNANSCPVDRTTFNSIYIRKCYGGKVKKMVTVQKPAQKSQEDAVDLDLEQTNCEVCGGSDREDRLLLCDGCDAGYHMECLTPPLDSVPVEEWFCPECEATNQSSRHSAEDLSDRGGVPSAARPATSRALPRALGPTRAIARTQQSERVRANVNRHRISQARSAQLAPTYLMQSTWLDETINAVVAGLNTAVYVRDVAPRVASRRRQTLKRRKVKQRKTSAAGKMSSTGVQRRKRRSRKPKSKKKLTHKNSADPRSRIASNLGMVKDRNSSSLPTVYRPSESTLSSMRADIGAASLSIYGDPFDLDPFVDQGPDVSQTEAASVPDLLGSILTGQSILLMDSSDVIINRDGSLKAAKPGLSSAVTASGLESWSDANTLIKEEDPSEHNDGRLPEDFCSSTNSPTAHRSTNLPSFTASQSALSFTAASSDLLSGGTPGFLPPQPIKSGPLKSSENSGVDFAAPSQAHATKAAVKPMWVDVSELPRIPRIKRESRVGPDDGPAGILRAGMNRPSGDKGRNQSEDQQKDVWTHRHRSKGDAFCSSFSSSASQPQRAPSLSSSSAVSFRINSSGNSWHARKLNMGCSSGEKLEDVQRRKEDQAKKRLLIRDKRMLLASHSRTSRGQESNIYDPCNPTTSDSGGSADEAEGRSLDCSREGPSWGDGEEWRLSLPNAVQEKTGSSQRSRLHKVPFSDGPPKMKEEPHSAKLDEAMENSGDLDFTKKEEKSKRFSGPPSRCSDSYQDSPKASLDAARRGSAPSSGPQSSMAPKSQKPQSAWRTDHGDTHKDKTRGGHSSAGSPPSNPSDRNPQKRRQFASLSKDSQRNSPSRSASSSSRKKSHERQSRNRNDGRQNQPAPSHRRYGPPSPTSSSGPKPERSESLLTPRERGGEYVQEKHPPLTCKERGGDGRRCRSEDRSTRKDCASSSRESLQRQAKDPSHRDVQLQDYHQNPSPSCPLKNNCRDSGGEDTMKDISKDTKPENNLKKEKLRLNDPTKSEQVWTSSSVFDRNEANIQKNPAESSEPLGIKSDQSSPKLCPTPPAASLPDLLPGATGPQPGKQDVPDVPDSDLDVDLMLDCPDFVKQEEEEADSFRDEGEQVSAAAVPKTKTQVKRVTWNIQEPEGPQPEKSATTFLSAELALYKLKLKQEGVRRSSGMSQTSAQETRGAVTDSPKKEVVGSTSTPDATHSRDPPTQQGASSGGESLWSKDKYLQKLHMQERAVEEVKLAMKPFYQRRDVNKDEYKEILRKAVQKVCHSKSGEINPVKVGNLVKAYVDKYKHARKRQKEAVLGEQTEPIRAPDSP
ncbi:uncharacterized protein phrf1 isoform X8 [Oryzias latipes]